MKENVLHQFINNIPQFVWWKDLESVFLGCNENVAKYVGLKTAKEIVGKTDFDIYDNKEDAEFVRKIDRKVISSGIPQLNFEEHLSFPNLGKRWISTSKVPWYNENKEIIGTIGWFDDITEFKEMKIQIDQKNKTLLQHSLKLKESNRDLELANFDLEKFSFAASHDLKEPVRTMQSFSKLLKQKEKNNLGKKSLQYLDYICESSDRMSKLIDDILGYARTGSEELITEHSDLKQIVSEKMIDLNCMINSKSAVIKWNLPQSRINLYPKLIGLVFYNLISNGIKFNNSKKPTITCDYSEEKDFWIFRIEDNGIGIDSKFVGQVFEPFKRLVGQNIEGSGLGLSICKRVVSLHGGDIWIEKSDTGNTVFKFSISKNLKHI